MAPTRVTRLRLEPSRSLLWALAALAALLLAAVAWLRFDPARLEGDEGTYVAMTESLVRDGDLSFEAIDAAWAREHRPQPAAVILQRSSRGISYSKPILYPLAMAPFVAAAGENGFYAGHLLLLLVAFALARAALARRPGGERAAELLTAFALASTVAVYAGWKMSESLQVALALAGLALTLAPELGARPTRGIWLSGVVSSPLAPWCGALLLGLLASLREPNATVAAVPVVAALLGRRPGRAAGLGMTAAAAYLAVLALTLALTGVPNPYKSPRSLFDSSIGYPAGPDAAVALARFDDRSALRTSSLELMPVPEPARSAYSALYFVIGRHSGVLVYAPVVVALLLALRRRPDRGGWAALAGFAALASFYLVWWPDNYFGGETCVGNRYLLSALPCLLFVPRELPTRRSLATAWLLALVVGASALVSVARTRELDPLSQNHAYAGVFRWLPFESTARGLDGRRDRYWQEDFVRFVDPFARVGPTSFELSSAAPGAEIEVATAWAGDPLHWLVVADAPDARLVISDWLGRRTHRLSPNPAGSGGPLMARQAPAWRYHRFWWPGSALYRVRLLRLRLETASGRPAHARVRYLGRHEVPSSGFEREVEPVALPSVAVAGGSARIEVGLLNRGGWSWDSEATLPVLLGARLEPLDGAGGSVERRAALPHAVAPGERVRAAVELRWPDRPGRYRLRVDLVLEDVAWFADRVGSPLAEGVVTVRPADGPAAPAPLGPSSPRDRTEPRAPAATPAAGA